MDAAAAQTTFRSQMYKKHTSFGPLLEVDMSKKCTPLWRKAISKSRHMLGPLLKVQMWFAWQEQGIVHLVKNEKFCRISKNDGRRGTFGEDLQRCISRGRRSTRDMFIRDVGTVRRSGR